MRQEDKNNRSMTVKEAAEYTGKTYQAINQCIHRGRLKFYIDGGRKYTTIAWLEEFERTKDLTEHAKMNRKPIFDESKGTYCVKHAAKMLGCSPLKVHDYIRSGLISSERVGSYHVIHLSEIEKMMDRLEKKAS